MNLDKSKEFISQFTPHTMQYGSDIILSGLGLLPSLYSKHHFFDKVSVNSRQEANLVAAQMSMSGWGHLQ